MNIREPAAGEWGSFLDRIVRHGEQNPHQEAIVSDDATLTYPELVRRVVAGANHLKSCGIDQGAVVGISLGSETDHLIASLALMAAGAAQITLATHDSPAVRVALAERIGLTHILADDPEFFLEAGQAVYWEPGCHQPGAQHESASGPGGARLLLKTSGTTGDMNIVAFGEADMAVQAERHGDYAAERLLRLASIEHNNSKRHRLYCVWAGGTNVFRPRGAVDVVDCLLRHRVTCLDISRMHAADLAASERAGLVHGVKLRTGGAAVPSVVRSAILEGVTRNLYVRYAATECGGISMARPGEHDLDETSGRPLDGVVVEIVGEDGAGMPPGQMGEIRLRAPGMASGYFDNPAESVRRFRDGWFYPGDVGYLRDDGQLVVQGRKDDMIILNGVNIAPAEIERVLERHPAVAAAAALPMLSRVHGQIPVAAVELRPGASITPMQLQIYARDHLALRAPRRILILERLPRNPQGKVLKRELGNLFSPAG